MHAKRPMGTESMARAFDELLREYRARVKTWPAEPCDPFESDQAECSARARPAARRRRGWLREKLLRRP